MRIFIVGNDAPGALERYCATAFHEMGHEIKFHDVYSEIIVRSRFLYTPVLCDLEQAILRYGFNKRLQVKIKEWAPDLVFVFKGIDLTPETLQGIRKLVQSPLLLNWNPDSPFDFGTSNTSANLIKSIPLYDVYFTWNTDLILPLREAGARQVEYLPFGYDPKNHHPVSLNKAEQSLLASQVSFVGNYTQERAELLEILVQRGIEVGIWGISWNEHLRYRNLLRAHLRGPVYEKDMSKIYSASVIAMNFLRGQNHQAHNMRTFEVPAIGAFMLSTRSRTQIEWLPEDVGASYFTTPQEMVDRVCYYLSHSNERISIAEEGHRRIWNKEHTYFHRMQQLLTIVNQL
jgi:spore maturation protein CgeB